MNIIRDNYFRLRKALSEHCRDVLDNNHSLVIFEPIDRVTVPIRIFIADKYVEENA